MVDEGGTIDSSSIRFTKHDIHSLGFESGNELVAVVSGCQCRKYRPLGTVGQSFHLDGLLVLGKLLLHRLIANGLAKE